MFFENDNFEKFNFHISMLLSKLVACMYVHSNIRLYVACECKVESLKALDLSRASRFYGYLTIKFQVSMSSLLRKIDYFDIFDKMMQNVMS